MSENNNTFTEKSEITFKIEEAIPPEVMRIDADGKFFVHGREVTTDIEVYNGLVEFTKHMRPQLEKSWGWERWFANDEKYCGKLLFVRKGEWSSKGKYHYHKIKDETFLVIESGLQLDYVEDGVFKTISLGRFDSFHVPPGMKHRFTATTDEGCYFVEASTTHRDDDSYRCKWDSENKGWVE